MKQKYSFFLITIATCLIFFIFCSILYKYDNKYTANKIKGQKGVIDLSNNDFNVNKIIQLSSGWEVYPEQQIEPENLKDKKPSLYAVLGQYIGLNFGNKKSPYFGTATYHLKVKLPTEVNSYTLEIPEVFSAYKLFINDRVVREYGDISIENYKAVMKNSSISFFARDYVDITFIVTNYSSFYGGLVYPMAFGLQENVEEIMFSRLIFRSMLLFISFTIGAAFIVVGIKINKTYLIYALMSFLFICYTSYPITHSIKAWGTWIYTFEAACNYGFIGMVLYLEGRIYNFNDEHVINKNSDFKSEKIFKFIRTDIRYFLYWFALFIIIVTLIPSRIICMSYTIMKITSLFRTIFKYCVFLYLIILAVYSVFNDMKYSKLMLIGFSIVGTSYVADRIYSLFEPIRFGWFYEISGFILLCIMGAVFTMIFSENYKRNEQLKVQLHMQKNYYKVVQDNILSTRKLRHNIKNHILVMKYLLESHDNERLWSYLEKYTQDLPEIKSLVFCSNPELNIILSYYYNLASNRNIEVNINSFNMPDNIEDIEPDLCVLIGNMLKNAMEACEKVKKRKPFIDVFGESINGNISIIVSNTYEEEPKIINNTFMSSKRIHKEGIGIPTIKTIVEKYNGQYKFEINKEKRIFEMYIIIFNHNHV